VPPCGTLLFTGAGEGTNILKGAFAAMRPLKVLVADDHRLILEAVQLALGDDEGIELVGEATDGSQVLPLVGRTSPDVVLLDLSMPKMDGLTCIDQLRKRYPDVTVVVLAG